MVEGGHRKETVVTGVMGTSTTKETKHNGILERTGGRGCVSRELVVTARGIGMTKLASAADSPRAGFCFQCSLGGPTSTAKRQLCLQRCSLRKGTAPSTQPGVCKGREMELGTWKKPRGFPAREPSVIVYDVQETTRSRRSFEALASTC